MGKKKKPQVRRQPERKRSTALILGAAALALAAGVFTWFWFGRHDPLGAAPLYTGGPRLAAETDNIDFGTVRFERWVTAKFRVRNVGDKTLKFAANPRVEVVEGC